MDIYLSYINIGEVSLWALAFQDLNCQGLHCFAHYICQKESKAHWLMVIIWGGGGNKAPFEICLPPPKLMDNKIKKNGKKEKSQEKKSYKMIKYLNNK